MENHISYENYCKLFREARDVFPNSSAVMLCRISEIISGITNSYAGFAKLSKFLSFEDYRKFEELYSSLLETADVYLIISRDVEKKLMEPILTEDKPYHRMVCPLKAYINVKRLLNRTYSDILKVLNNHH